MTIDKISCFFFEKNSFLPGENQFKYLVKWSLQKRY